MQEILEMPEVQKADDLKYELTLLGAHVNKHLRDIVELADSGVIIYLFIYLLIYLFMYSIC
jgi:hypothetical protein